MKTLIIFFAVIAIWNINLILTCITLMERASGNDGEFIIDYLVNHGTLGKIKRLKLGKPIEIILSLTILGFVTVVDMCSYLG